MPTFKCTPREELSQGKREGEINLQTFSLHLAFSFANYFLTDSFYLFLKQGIPGTSLPIFRLLLECIGGFILLNIISSCCKN